MLVAIVALYYHLANHAGYGAVGFAWATVVRCFFRQARLTRGNQVFYVYKFRSNNRTYSGLSPEEAFKKMGRPELVKEYRANGDYLPNDPRITHIGRFIRRTSIDELPQLFNVLRGDISLVGPRALVPEELSQYSRKHTILSVKSGVTGLAQVSGRTKHQLCGTSPTRYILCAELDFLG